MDYFTEPSCNPTRLFLLHSRSHRWVNPSLESNSYVPDQPGPIPEPACVITVHPAGPFPETADLVLEPQELFPPLQGEKGVQGPRGWAGGQKAQVRSGGHPRLGLSSSCSWENPSGNYKNNKKIILLKGNNLNVHQEEIGQINSGTTRSAGRHLNNQCSGDIG